MDYVQMYKKKELPTLGEEKKKSNKGLYFTGFGNLFLNRIFFPSHNMRFNEWS